MKKILITAADQNWGIGLKGNLPWHVPADLAQFKRRTMGATLLVGRRTMDTLPPLKGRRILSISRSGNGDFLSIEAALRELEIEALEEVFIAGGSEIYKASLEILSSAEVTRIPGVHECDTWMPDLTAHGWHIVKNHILDKEVVVETWIKK